VPQVFHKDFPAAVSMDASRALPVKRRARCVSEQSYLGPAPLDLVGRSGPARAELSETKYASQKLPESSAKEREWLYWEAHFAKAFPLS